MNAAVEEAPRQTLTCVAGEIALKRVVSAWGLRPCHRCHAGFVGVRCEHADLLAIVATNHRQQTVATALVMCVVGCVLVMLLCALLQ